MWGKLNLPIFLFKLGLLTLINMDSLIFLARPCPSLTIIWKFFWVLGWPVLLLWWCMGEESFRCSLNHSPKVLEVSPMYSSSQVRLLHWNQYMAPCLLTMGSLLLGGTRRFLMVLLPLKWICIPVGWVPAVPWLLAPLIDLTGTPGKSFLHLVQSPLRVITIGKSFPEMLHYLL